MQRPPVNDDRHHPDFPERMRKVQEDLGRAIGKHMPKGWGFALLVFDFNNRQGGMMGYISNAQRADMVHALREQADQLEGKARA